MFSLLVISIASGQNDTSEWDAQLSRLPKVEKDGQNCVKKLEHQGKEGVLYIFMVSPFNPKHIMQILPTIQGENDWVM